MITKDNNLKVMELFFKQPNRSFHLREVGRLTGLSPTGVVKIIKKLEHENLIISNKDSITKNITPHFDGNFIQRKRLYNIYSLYESGLMSYLKEYFEFPKAIILFGSYAQGTDIEKSDIDIAIFSDDKEHPNVEKFEKILARKISLHVLNRNTMSSEFKNSIANGITL